MQMKPFLAALSAVLVAGCTGSSNTNTATAVTTGTAVVAAASTDYQSGAISLVQTTTPFTAQNSEDATISDISVRAGTDHFFIIQRYGTDQISRYEASSPSMPTYTYSTNDSDSVDSNPYDIVELNSTKAYLIRYGAGSVWIVNPSATTEADFKIGEIDLSQYSSSGVPEMSAGLISNGKLYVAMQVLDENFNATQPGYVAVIDTSTDTEITTGSSSAPLKGILLPTYDPYRLVAVPGSDNIIVAADGGYAEGNDGYSHVYNGGIVSINPDNGYATTLVLDDGDSSSHPYGAIVDVSVAAVDRGYFLGNSDVGGSDTLYRFDPTGATAPVAVTGFANLQLSAISVYPLDGNLWVGQPATTAPGLSVLGFANGTETVVEPLIGTVLNPLNIDFMTNP